MLHKLSKLRNEHWEKVLESICSLNHYSETPFPTHFFCFHNQSRKLDFTVSPTLLMIKDKPFSQRVRSSNFECNGLATLAEGKLKWPLLTNFHQVYITYFKRDFLCWRSICSRVKLEPNYIQKLCSPRYIKNDK